MWQSLVVAALFDEGAISTDGGHLKAGAALRPIAGKRGSHGYCTGLETGCTSVGDYPLSRREQSPRARRIPCRSGFSREAGAAVDGTGFAGVRG